MVFFSSVRFVSNVETSPFQRRKKKKRKKAKDKSLNDSSRNLVLIANGTSKHSYE